MFRVKGNKNYGNESLDKALPLTECFAKTYRAENGKNNPGRTVFDHCHIVGEVAREIIARMPDWLREKFFPSGSELIASAHDIGKVSPTFQEKIYRAIDGYVRNSKAELKNIDPDLEKQWGGHGGVSQATIKNVTAKFIPEILGQHHGYSPSLGYRIASDAIFGGQSWQNRRLELIDKLKLILNCDWPTVNTPLQAQVLSGLTTISDWIGSNSFFENPNKKEWQTDIKKALDAAGFVKPKLKAGLTFSDVFNFTPKDAQEKLINAIKQPGVYIMEAPMGLGKTEAALYAAYIAMLTDKAMGIYFALPTQLTSDKIYERVNVFLQKILAADCHHSQALLLHSNAWIKQTEMGEEGQPGGSWFLAAKRGILAPFAVGTIDQALMAVMNVKHGFVRTFGLAGKVVILDEVHTYDAYTGTILDKLVDTLRELHCTVIILSATLTQKRRQDFLKHALIKNDYPLISVLCDESLQEISVSPLSNSTVKIQLCEEDRAAIDEVLLRAEQGQQVLWIENTVEKAQDYYKELAAKASEINVECGLLHSRFLQVDRDENEKHWVELYGKNNSSRSQRGRILIGTQVLEQSLDIDSDFLVTRMCPSDMLLQRLGRLWRHSENKRPASAVQEVWILAPKLKDAIENPKKAFDKTASVYSPYVLCRSLEVWEKLKTVNLPEQIRSLIEATYCERVETDKMNQYQNDLENKREKLERLALIGISKGGKTLDDDKVGTRYEEQDREEVFLFRSYRHNENLGTYVTLLNGDEIYLPRNGKMQDRKKWRENTAKLMKNTVRVAEHQAPKPASIKSLNWLKDYFYLTSILDKRIKIIVQFIHFYFWFMRSPYVCN